MRVKTVREHNNVYGIGEKGVDVTKKPGTEYDLPDAQAETLIAAGLVAAVAAPKAAAPKAD